MSKCAQNMSPAPGHIVVAPVSDWVTRWLGQWPAGASVLDVACGSGRHVRWLAQRGLKVTALDRDAQAVEPLRALAQVVVADLEAETQYRGIRPAPGYPACPDHRVKAQMFEVLKASEIGMGLTESLAMTPAASVSGFYLAHPQAAYFNVGRIGDDQIADWARRMEMEEGEARRGLASVV